MKRVRRVTKRLTLPQLILAADHAYGDESMVVDAAAGRLRGPMIANGRVLDPPKSAVGDLLADFIAAELAETFDPKAPRAAQLQEAWRVMDRAQRQVGAVADAFLNWQIADGYGDQAFTQLGKSLLERNNLNFDAGVRLAQSGRAEAVIRAAGRAKP
jgi:hypothetical protein